MKTQQIPRQDWAIFFDDLSKKWEGQGVALEVFGQQIGDQIEERQMFFAGMTAELTNKDGRQDRIEMMLGGKADGHLTHMISAPTEVDLQRADSGAYAALQIKAADGTTSLLRLI